MNLHLWLSSEMSLYRHNQPRKVQGLQNASKKWWIRVGCPIYQSNQHGICQSCSHDREKQRLQSPTVSSQPPTWWMCTMLPIPSLVHISSWRGHSRFQRADMTDLLKYKNCWNTQCSPTRSCITSNGYPLTILFGLGIGTLIASWHTSLHSVTRRPKSR